MGSTKILKILKSFENADYLGQDERATFQSFNLSDLCCCAKERAATGIFKGIKCDLSNTTVHGRLWRSLSLIIIILALFQLYLGFALNKISLIMQ